MTFASASHVVPRNSNGTLLHRRNPPRTTSGPESPVWRPVSRIRPQFSRARCTGTANDRNESNGGENVSTWTASVVSGHRFATDGARRPGAIPTRWCSLRVSTRTTTDRQLRSDVSRRTSCRRPSAFGRPRATARAEYQRHWGCVGLLPNPDATRLPSEQCKRWSEFVKECGERRSNYGELAKVNAGVSEDGFLTIPWPKLANNGSTLAFDALLATATKPKPNRLLSPKEIAEAWRTPKGREYDYYFHKNRENGIKTSQDDKVARLLAHSGDVLQLSKSGKRAIGRVGRAPSHAATSNKLLMN